MVFVIDREIEGMFARLDAAWRADGGVDVPVVVKRKRQARAVERARFLRGSEWGEVRRRVLRRDGMRCVRCGSGDRLCVDHIVPRSRVRSLELDEANLRVFCWPCNRAKGTRVEVDVVL